MAMKNLNQSLPQLGFGLGLRPKHYSYIFENWPEVDWFEVISENFMDTDGRPKRNLARIAERYPVVIHGVALSIGTVDPLNSEYLQKLKKLIAWLKPAWISDHLCWTGIAHRNTHDLLPVPYTEEALKHITQRIRQVQDFLEMPIALENPSTYLEFKSSNMPEAEFIARMAEDSGCRLLLDVNNVYVTCYNHRLDPKAYIDALPLERVQQIHLSGHSNYGTHIIDTHDDHVVDDVWALYQYVVKKSGHVPNTMVEWDDKIPEFPVLFAELAKAKTAALTAMQHAPLPNLAKPQTPYIANRPTELREEQSRMQDAIMGGSGFASKAEEWIRAKEQFSAAEQLKVYTNAYRYRLYDVVAEDYPVLQHYLGNERFEGLINSFVNTIPSEHFNIGRYAAKLPQFITKHIAGDEFAFELCELETAICQLSDPAETIALTPEHLAGMTPEVLMQSKLEPREALQLFEFNYPVNKYYLEVNNEVNPSAPEPGKTYLVVFRHEDTVWRMDLAAGEYNMLKLLFSGHTVGQALEIMQGEDIAANLGEWFARWMRNGLLAYKQANKLAA